MIAVSLSPLLTICCVFRQFCIMPLSTSFIRDNFSSFPLLSIFSYCNIILRGVSNIEGGDKSDWILGPLLLAMKTVLHRIYNPYKNRNLIGRFLRLFIYDMTTTPLRSVRAFLEAKRKESSNSVIWHGSGAAIEWYGHRLAIPPFHDHDRLFGLTLLQPLSLFSILLRTESTS